MSYIARIWVYAACLAVIFITSVSLNLFLYREVQNLKMLKDVASERARINDDEFRDIFISYIRQQSDNNMELARGQGRQEALATIAANLPVQESDTSAIFHAGYQSGYNTSLQLIDSILENVDDKVKETFKTSTGDASSLLEYWKSQRKFISASIEASKSASSNATSSNSGTWGNNLIKRIRSQDINTAIEEARIQGEIDGYHKATEDGLCPAKETPKPEVKKDIKVGSNNKK
jgi:hypothetical protein